MIMTRDPNSKEYIIPAQAPLIGSAAVCDCPGENEQFEKCLDGVCGSPFAQADEQLCSWSEWADWSPCVGDCPKALRQRTRVCRDGEGLRRRPRFPGFQCQCAGDMRQSESCVPSHCRAAEDRFLVSRGTFDDEDMCQWSVWSEWSRCGADFLKQRTRFCTGQKSLVNNCECIGRAFEQTSCTPRIDAHNFAVNATVLERSRKMLQERLKEKNAASEDSCQWNAWNEWSTCSATCGDGERLRKRLCPCRRCGGISTETEACRLASCYSTSSGDRVRNPFD
uniref:TSP1_spondin domain-containing protein n=1 Tax=Steinernema glaseri TaxID=37863 RepID=A0A1I8ADE6_9BILA